MERNFEELFKAVNNVVMQFATDGKYIVEYKDIKELFSFNDLYETTKDKFYLQEYNAIITKFTNACNWNIKPSVFKSLFNVCRFTKYSVDTYVNLLSVINVAVRK